MELKNALIWSGVAVGAILLLRNREQARARQADTVTDDLTDVNSRIALELQQIMNPYQIIGIGWTTSVNKSDYGKAADILNCMLKITDWNTVKEKFRKLCDGVYTLSQALQSSLSTDFYNLALDLAVAKKVITTDTAVCVRIKSGGGSTQITYNPNTILGAFKSSTGSLTTVINGFEGIDNFIFEDEMITYTLQALTNKVKLV